MEREFLAAAIQFGAGRDKERNLARARALIERAGDLGARLVVLPELFSWRGPAGEEQKAAESIPGRTSEFLAELARSLAVVLVGGSFLELGGKGDTKAFNTSLVFDRKGKIIARYRKIHLFDVDIPGKVVVRESETRQAGTECITCETDLGRLGLAICYDLRFPELFRRLAAAGAEVICMPSAFTFATGEAHWEPLIRARAIENQVYFIAANQIGAGASGIVDYGNSLIADPWGRVVARASDQESVVIGQVSRDYLRRVRKELPCGQQIRLDR